MAKKPVTIDALDEATDKWMRRLRRAINEIDKLSIKRKRMLKPKPVARISIVAPEPVTAPVKSEPKASDVSDISWSEMTGADLAIPDFLKRQKDAAMRDQAALEEIAADKERRAKAKRDSKGVVKSSKKLGVDAQKMPLSGKAALAHIRNG